MKATARKWGNSAAVRIPAPIMQAMRLDLDEIVDVREEAGRIPGADRVTRRVPEIGRALNWATDLQGRDCQSGHTSLDSLRQRFQNTPGTSALTRRRYSG
jgi:antitoxin component of MazEF toxin-antitoxin module